MAVEHLFIPDYNFGLFGETPFKDVQGSRVYYVDPKSGGLEKDAQGLPRVSAARISGMLMPRGGIADMATMVYEASQEHGGVELVLGGEVALPVVEETPGVDLDALSLPPTPPTPE